MVSLTFTRSKSSTTSRTGTKRRVRSIITDRVRKSDWPNWPNRGLLRRLSRMRRRDRLRKLARKKRKIGKELSLAVRAKMPTRAKRKKSKVKRLRMPSPVTSLSVRAPKVVKKVPEKVTPKMIGRKLTRSS